MKARAAKEQPGAAPTTPTITLTLTVAESVVLQDALSLAGDCAALYFGIENTGSSGLGERGYTVAVEALSDRTTRLEELIKTLDDADLYDRLRLARVAAQKSETAVRQ